MTTAYFDCFSGISGDMTLGALVDLGVPFEELKAALKSLPVDGYEITLAPVSRCGIGGSQVSVKLTANHTHEHTHSHSHSHEHGHDHEHGHSHSHEHGHSHSHSHEHGHDHGHSHDVPGKNEKPAAAEPHSHSHEHDHSHTHSHEHLHSHTHDPSHSHSHSHSHGHQPHRGFSEISRIINESGFSATVKARAIEAFRHIAVEEAAVHETTVEQVHFHEVGAVDAIVDIVGAMWCIERLGITRVLASQIAVGSGTVYAAHGHMPVPAPATARLLQGIPVCTGPVTGELTTPTGAAIIATLAESFGPLDNFSIDRIGYGAGTRTYPQHTNYLRVLLGTSAGTEQPGRISTKAETLVLLSTDIDDMPGEFYGHTLERLMQAGALDAHVVPIQMKKNRPGISLRVLCEPAAAGTLRDILFLETTTLGIRSETVVRHSLAREIVVADTPFGPCKVKLALDGDTVLKATPEYEDCHRLAETAGVPLRDVYNAALAAAPRTGA